MYKKTKKGFFDKFYTIKALYYIYITIVYVEKSLIAVMFLDLMILLELLEYFIW